MKNILIFWSGLFGLLFFCVGTIFNFLISILEAVSKTAEVVIKPLFMSAIFIAALRIISYISILIQRGEFGDFIENIATMIVVIVMLCMFGGVVVFLFIAIVKGISAVFFYIITAIISAVIYSVTYFIESIANVCTRIYEYFFKSIYKQIEKI